MTTWKEAGDILSDMILHIGCNHLAGVDYPKTLDLQTELYELMDTLPIAQPTAPHDFTNLARMLELAFQLGHWWGRRHPNNSVPVNTPKEGG